MTRRGLVLPSLFLLLFLAAIVIGAGWFVPSLRGVSAPASKVRISETIDECPEGEALQRWRSAQPPHWRACLLQP